MRDAVRAKATYNITTKNIESIPVHDSPEPVSPTEPLSPVSMSPIPEQITSALDETVANGGVSATASESSKGVANGDGKEGECGRVADGNSRSEPANVNGEVANGVPETD